MYRVRRQAILLRSNTGVMQGFPETTHDFQKFDRASRSQHGCRSTYFVVAGVCTLVGALAGAAVNEARQGRPTPLPGHSLQRSPIVDTAVSPSGGTFPKDLATQQCWGWGNYVWQGHLLATVPTAETFLLYVRMFPRSSAPSGSMTSIVHFGSATSEQLPALYLLPGSTRLRACVDSRRDGAVCCDTENGWTGYR